VKNTTLLIIVLLLFVSCKKENIQALKTKTLVLLEKAEEDATTDEQKKHYLDSSYTYLAGAQNDSVTRNLFFKISDKYYDLGFDNEYYKVSQKLYKLSLQKSDTAHIAKSLYYIGDYHEGKAQIDSALHYYILSGKYYKAVSDTLNYGRVSLYKAGMLYDSGNYIESEIEAINALRLLDKVQNTRLTYECYTILALSLEEQNNFEKALEYFNLALEQIDKLSKEDYPKQKVLNSRASCFNNIGGIYEKKKEFKKAVSMYFAALQTENLKDSKPNLYAMLLSNLGYAKMRSGDYTNVKKLLFKALKIRDSLNVVAGTVSSKIRIGEYYLTENDTATAVKYITDGYKLAKQIKSNHDILNSLKLLSVNDAKNKVYYSQLYIKVSDSLRNEERATRNKFARIAYETDEVEAKNEILSQQNAIILIAFAVTGTVLLCLFFMYRLRSKNKELLYIQEQQASKEYIYTLMLEQQAKTERAREEERKKIAMDLHDGIINSIFTTRFNLMQIETPETDKRDELVKELENAQEEIRRVSHVLKKNLLFKDKSFADLIKNYIESQQAISTIKFDLYIDNYINWQLLPTENKIHLYRVVQELVYNVIKHSGAATCTITFFKNPDGILIRIWDDGQGFDINKAKKGIGLKNIADRVEAINGTIIIKSGPEAGTHVEIVVKNHDAAIDKL
jgi:signal transduction histidine kinase